MGKSAARGAIFLPAVVAVLLAGCSANWSSVYREFSLDRGDSLSSVLMDAKQRAILAKRRDAIDGAPAAEVSSVSPLPWYDDRESPKKPIVACAEPSPDTFSAFSQSLAGSGTFSGAPKEVQLALSLALAESAGELRRARTIQLLRDGLFTACLGYMNGGLNAVEYRRLLNKYADATVTLLAIEQITPQQLSPAITLSMAGDANTTITNKPATTPTPSTPATQTPNPNAGGEAPAATPPTAGAPPSTTPPTAPTPTTPTPTPPGNGTVPSVGTGETTPGQPPVEGADGPAGSAEKGKLKSGATQRRSTKAADDSTSGTGGSGAGAATGPTIKPPVNEPAAPGAETSSTRTSATPAKGADPAASGTLPAPSVEVLLVVQYLAKSFLIETLVNECLEAAKAADKTKMSVAHRDFCDVVLRDAMELPKYQVNSSQPAATSSAQAKSGSERGFEVPDSSPSRQPTDPSSRPFPNKRVLPQPL